jgi:hypothetical protein
MRQRASDLAVVRRSDRSVFLVKPMRTDKTDAPVVLEDEARGRT